MANPVAHFGLVFLCALSWLFFSLWPQSAAAAEVPRYWWSRGVGGGGAFFSPAIDPLHGDTLFVSTDMGVVFRSLNGGARWETYPFASLQGSRLAKVQFTSDPSVLYVLDGRIDYAEYFGGAIFKSIDGGASWFRLTADPCTSDDATRKKLRADPSRTDRLVLGHDTGLWFSADGGTNWTPFYSPGSGCYLADAFFAGPNIFAAGNFGLYVSTNGGASFASEPLTGIGAGEGIVSFAGAMQNGKVRLYCITTDSATADGADDGGPSPAESIYDDPSVYRGIYARDWPAGAWTLRTSGIAATHYPAFIAATTGRTDIVYAAGQSSDYGWPVIYRSANAGTNWTSVFNGTQNQNVQTGWEGHQGDLAWSWGGGALGFAVSQSDPDRVMFSDWGFVHGTTNAGSTWQALYVPPADRNPANAYTPKHRAYHGIGLEDTSCWWLTWLDSSTVFASFTDIGAIRSTNAGATWIAASADVGYNTIYCCVTNAAGTAYAAASSIHDLYGSTRLMDNPIDRGNGEILFSTNKAASWQRLHNFTNPVIWLALSPTNANVMYASVVNSTNGGIFVTSNLLAGAGSTWSRCGKPPRTEGHPLSVHVLNDGTLACSYSGRRDSTSNLFTHSSGVFVSTNSGASWVDRSVDNMHCWTKDLVIYPFDPSQNTWFAGVFDAWGSGRPYNAGGLYRSTNRGQAWTAFTCDTRPELYRVASISFHPANTNFAFLTTEDHGLLYSTNILAPTPVFLSATNYPFFQPMRVFTNPYDTNEIWSTSVGNGLRVGWLTEPRPVLTQLTVTGDVANVSGSGCDGQRLFFQCSADLEAWENLATNIVVDGCFSNTDAAISSPRFYRAKLASPAIGQE